MSPEFSRYAATEGDMQIVTGTTYLDFWKLPNDMVGGK